MTAIISNRTSSDFNDEQGSHPKLRAVSLAIATPVLALALAWGSVGACAYTQHSLMGLYENASTTG